MGGWWEIDTARRRSQSWVCLIPDSHATVATLLNRAPGSHAAYCSKQKVKHGHAFCSKQQVKPQVECQACVAKPASLLITSSLLRQQVALEAPSALLMTSTLATELTAQLENVSCILSHGT